MSVTRQVMVFARQTVQDQQYERGATSVGDLLRDLRRRRQSQLALDAEAEISERHLSFVESGRPIPSRYAIMCVADTHSVPLRDGNGMLVAPWLPRNQSPDKTQPDALQGRWPARYEPHTA